MPSGNDPYTGKEDVPYDMGYVVRGGVIGSVLPENGFIGDHRNRFYSDYYGFSNSGKMKVGLRLVMEVPSAN